MKKKALMLLLAGMTVFSLGAASMAEDVEDDAYVDYDGEGEIDADEDIDLDVLFSELEEMAAEPVEINWEDYEEEVKKHENWEGEFVLIEDLGMKLYLPKAFEYTPASEEDFEMGELGYFETNDATISVTYFELEDEDVELMDYAAEVYINYGMDVLFTTVNGMDSFIYTYPDDAEEWLDDEMDEEDYESEEYGEEEISEEEAFGETFATLVIPAEDGIMIEFTFSPFDMENESDLGQMMTAILASLQIAE